MTDKPKQTRIGAEVEKWQADRWEPNRDEPIPTVCPEDAFEAGIRRGIEMAAERLEEEAKDNLGAFACHYVDAAADVRKLLSE